MLISRRAAEFIERQTSTEQAEILDKLDQIAADPLNGHFLPFPYMPGTLGTASNHYLITYTVENSESCILDVVRIPAFSGISEG